MQRTERSTSVERKKFPVDFPDAFLSVSVQRSGDFSICLRNLRMIRYLFNKSLLIKLICYSLLLLRRTHNFLISKHSIVSGDKTWEPSLCFHFFWGHLTESRVSFPRWPLWQISLFLHHKARFDLFILSISSLVMQAGRKEKMRSMWLNRVRVELYDTKQWVTAQ